MGPSLVEILRKTLAQIEQNVNSDTEEPAVIELRKQLARSIAELDMVKSDRRTIARRLYLVTPRSYGILRGDSGGEDEKPLELITMSSRGDDDEPPDQCA